MAEPKRDATGRRTQKRVVSELKKTIATRPKGGSTGPSNIAEAVGSRTAKSRGQLDYRAGQGEGWRRSPDKVQGTRQYVFSEVTPHEWSEAINSMMTPEEFNKKWPNSIRSQVYYEALYAEVKAKRDAFLDPAAVAQRKYGAILRDALDPIIEPLIGQEDPVKFQTRVGGTKGSPNVIDRSEAMKKAWATRKKLYGPSGFKDK